jgi:ABC-type glycerol-3-phosphate transport system permease component
MAREGRRHEPAGRPDFTVPRGLKSLLDQFGFGGEWHWEIIVTASAIATLPMIVLFLLGQRHFVQGIATTGNKGRATTGARGRATTAP